jgi:hypothetical protein
MSASSRSDRAMMATLEVIGRDPPEAVDLEHVR